jgi:hypothetical protein
MAAAAVEKVDRTVVVATDVAAYYLFHPDDLAHRRTAPAGWTGDDFACGAEFAAGNLVAVDTGGDGGAALRVTNGELSPREKARATGSWAFRYRVRHGRVLLDGGLHVPGDGADKGPPPDDHWVAVPNGDYQVTLYAIDRSVGNAGGAGPEFDKTLPEYVFQFRPSARLEGIKVLSKTPPRLIPGEPVPAANAKPAWAAWLEDTSAPLKRSYPAVVKEGSPLAPGAAESFEVSQAAYDALSVAGEFVVVSGGVPGVGVLARDAGGGSADGKWTQGARGLRLVKVNALAKGEPLPTAAVSPLSRPATKVSAKDVTALKAAFAKYARTNAPFRKATPHPDYEAERVEAVESPSALTNLLLYRVPLPPDQRAKLLPLSDAGRIRGLQAFLDSAPQTAAPEAAGRAIDLRFGGLIRPGEAGHDPRRTSVRLRFGPGLWRGTTVGPSIVWGDGNAGKDHWGFAAGVPTFASELAEDPEGAYFILSLDGTKWTSESACALVRLTLPDGRPAVATARFPCR